MTETFVHVWIATVESQKSDNVLEQLREVEQATLPLHGFKSVRVLLNEERTRVMCVSDWEAQHDWNRSQWEEHVQDAVARMFRSVTRLDSQIYREVFRLARA